MDVAIWNALHDGTIEAIDGRVPGDVTLRVAIGYLCDELPTRAEHLAICLSGCTRLEFRPFDREPVIDLPAIAAREVEILSAQDIENAVAIVCVGGVLTAAYDEARATLAEGRSISQAELYAAAKRYWAGWSESHRSGAT